MKKDKKNNSTNKTNKSTPNLENKEIKKPFEDKKKESDPTKYGDWQINGRAIDF